MRNPSSLPPVGKIPADTGDATRLVLTQMKEIIEVREGRRGNDFLDKAVTYRDLVTLGLITEAQVPRK